MALSMLLRSTKPAQSYLLLSKSLALANKNITTLSAFAHSRFSVFANGDSLASSKNHISILPAVRHMSGGDHRNLWKVEKLVSASLLVLLPACVAYPTEILDNIAAIAIVAHFHWGLQAIAQDYLRPIVVGRLISYLGIAAAYMVTVVTLTGLLFFNYTDIGIGEFVRQIWQLK